MTLTKRSSIRKARARKDALILCGMVLAVFCLLGWMSYNYYTYRTLTGNPNVYPAAVGYKGTVGSHSFYSPALGRRMNYEVYLPPGYYSPQNVGVRYPVVYLLHGAPGANSDWFVIGGADAQMDALLARKEVRPMILVAPEGSPSRFAPSDEYVNGPMGRWATYTTRDLVRRIDSRYRTVASKNGRAIAGLSEGAYAAVNLALKHPNEYGVAGSFSGYFTEPPNQRAFAGNVRLAAANSPAEYLPDLTGPLPKIYLYVGRSEGISYVLGNRAFAGELAAKGVPHEFHTYPGTHSWSLWRSRLSGFFEYASKNLQTKGR